jgi:hypothetical protein
MPINVKSGSTGGTFTPPPFEAGETYFARVVQIVDLGLQPGGEYQGNPKPDAEQIMFTFEFADVRNDEDKPAWLSVKLQLPKRWEDSGSFQTFHVKSNLYKFLEVLYPKGLYKGKNPSYCGFAYNFDWNDILGAPCQLQVTVIEKDDKTRAYIVNDSVARIPSKFLSSVPELENEPRVISMDSSLTQEDWDALFPWVRKMISESLDPNVAELAARMESNPEPTRAPVKAVNKSPKKAAGKLPAETPDDDFYDDDVPF